jgi:glycosyltransferase involved in cell wall biosynthesis
MQPFFSVITATFNRADCLEKCLSSVFNQSGVSIEHIVIDGGSTDGSMEIIQRWSDRLAYWISEPDKGIADAMNKGIQRARGKWVLFLHSDDEFWDSGSLAEVVAILNRENARIVGFPIRLGNRTRAKTCYSRGGTPWIRFKTGFAHQGAFIQQSVFATVGMHDTELRYDMDYDFFLRAWLQDVEMATYSEPVPTLMSDAGISSQRDWPSLAKRFREERLIHFRHADNLIWRIMYTVYWPPYLAYRWLKFLMARL